MDQVSLTSGVSTNSGQAQLGLGFPVTLALSWMFDLTSKGVTRPLPVNTEMAATIERPVSPGTVSPAASPPVSAEPGEERPGPLSMLIRELAQAPGESLLSAWKHEPRTGDKVGRFEIRREIGRGGFGVVYEAQDGELGRLVALKALRPHRTGKELSAEWVKREAEATARLDHPCIVTLFDVGTSSGGPYLVMELLRGETLSKRLAAGPLSVKDALHVAKEIARGLAHAHKRGILHRDLKPANVFLCEDGLVKLLDFGLAHLLGGARPGGSGTPGYMPPEQARGDEIDARADVYAAAMTLREMLTGRRGPASEAPVPRALARSIERALSANQEDRPRDGTAWLEEIVAVQKAIQRPRKVGRVAGIALASLVLGAATAYLVARHEKGSSRAPQATSPSVAVLPFADLSPNHDQEYFADGVAEEILNALARVEGLKVVGRTSSFSFKGRNEELSIIGQKLGASAILEGSVRKEGTRLRIRAQLVNAADGVHIWSETFERELLDVFAIQDEIARSVSRALEARLLPGRRAAPASARTGNPEAYRLYLLGRDLTRTPTEASSRGAIDALERSVKLDPDFAPAHAQLAMVTYAHTFAGYPNAPSGRELAELKARSVAEAEKAIALAPDLADGYWARAFVRAWGYFDWAGSQADLERALGIAPGDVQAQIEYAILIASLGRMDEAQRFARRAAEADPLASRALRWLGVFQMASGHPDQAEQTLRRGLEVSPDNPFLLRELGFAYLIEGKAKEALELFEHHPVAWMRKLGLALSQHRLGRDAESRRAMAHLPPYWRAVAHAERGERDQAIQCLEKALAERDEGLRRIRFDPFLWELRGDPRYVAVLRKMNLPVD